MTPAEYLPESREATATLGQSHGWFRAMRGPEPLELIRTAPLAYVLAAVIAHRAQYRDGFNRYNLALGEAFLGDHENYGMSERQYRTAKEQLDKWGFATFRTTNKGTIGKLIDTRLFSIRRLESDGQKDTRATDSRRAADGQPTTTKNYKNAKNAKNLRVGASRFLKTESIDPTK